jgi:hypothetical protein
MTAALQAVQNELVAVRNAQAQAQAQGLPANLGRAVDGTCMLSVTFAAFVGAWVAGTFASL